MSAGSPSKKLGQFLRAMARRFAEAGIDTPMLDARVLMCAATGLTPEKLIMQENATIAPRAQIFTNLGGRALHWDARVALDRSAGVFRSGL